MLEFVLGFIFCLSIQPLLESITSLLMSFVEMLKSYMAVKISNNNQKMNSEETTSHPIGFALSGEEVETDDI